MFKFLRKYNKWILAVGGTLLMIVFLIPQAIEGLAQTAGVRGVVRATVGPEDRRENVTWDSWNQYRVEADVINRLERVTGEALIPGVGRIDGTGHWFLLVREAQMAGLVGSPGAITVPEEQIQQIAWQVNVRPEVIQRTFARLDAVQRLVNMYMEGGPYSDRRLRRQAARMFHTVDVQFITLAADADAVDYEPTEEELEAHLDAYGDMRPGEGEMGFGYRLPDRVQVEWIRVDAADIRERLKKSDEMDGVAQRVHWRRDPDGIFPSVPPRREGEPPPPVPDEVREHLLESLLEQRLDSISRYLSDQIRASQRGLSRRDGYFLLPDDWRDQRLSLRDLAERARNRFNIALPDYRAIGDRWLTIDELAELEGIGQAWSTLYGPDPVYFPEMNAVLREFGGSPLILLQEGAAGPPIHDDEENIYVFRVIGTDPSRSPQSVDEVRDQLVADLKRKAHFEQMVAEISEIESAARERGMLSVALAHDAEIVAESVEIGTSPRRLPGIGVHRATTEAIIDRAMALPRDVPISELSPEQRVFALPVQDHLAVLIVRVVDQDPLKQSEFEMLAAANQLQTLMIEHEVAGWDRVREAFSFDTLAKRHNFKVIAVEEEEIEEIEAIGGTPETVN